MTKKEFIKIKVLPTIFVALFLIAWIFVVVVRPFSCNEKSKSGIAGITPTEEFYVNDFANVMAPEDKTAICEIGKELEAATKAQIVIVTVNSLRGGELRSTAYSIAEGWGIGDKELDNGVLIFLAVEDREYSIEVGYGLEGALPDITTGKIQDEVITPYFKSSHFSEGLKQGYIHIADIIYEEYGIPSPLEINEETIRTSNESSGNETYSSSIVFFAVATFFMVFGLIAKRIRNGFFGFGGSSSGGGSSGGGGSFGGGGSGRSF